VELIEAVTRKANKLCINKHSYLRGFDRTRNAFADLDVVDDNTLAMPKGLVGYKPSPELEEPLSDTWLGCSSSPATVSIAIPKGRSRLRAAEIVTHAALKCTSTLEADSLAAIRDLKEEACPREGFMKAALEIDRRVHANFAEYHLDHKVFQVAQGNCTVSNSVMCGSLGKSW